MPDPVLNDIYLSRLATRAILDVHLNKELSYNFCSPFFYFDQAYRDGCYVALAWDMAGMHDHAAQLLRVYCKDVKDVPKGPIWFDGKPLQLGMLENGLWNTRPGQWDTQGQNIWALVQHYKLSGDRAVAGKDGLSLHPPRGDVDRQLPHTSIRPRSRTPRILATG